MSRKSYSGQVLESLGLTRDAALSRHVDGADSTPIDKHDAAGDALLFRQGLGDGPTGDVQRLPVGSPTAIVPLGGVALVGYSADAVTGGKGFALLLLGDATGEVINVTDNGWTAAGAFRTGEGVLSITVPAGLAAGTVIYVSNINATPSVVTSTGVTITTFTKTGSPDPSGTGDAWLVYQGAVATPTFLFAIDFADGNTTYQGDSTNTNTSAVPTGLTLGTNALAFGLDNGAYTGPLTGTTSQILANIATPANWTTNDTALVTYPATFTINAVANGVLTIADASVAEGNSGDTDLVFTVTRASGSSGAVSATYTITNGTTDAADFGTGFTATGTVNFANGATTAQIHVPIHGDTDFEPNEAFSVALSAPTGGATLGAQATATGTITNDDASPMPVLSVDSPSVVEGNSGSTNLIFTVSLNQASASTVTVNYSTANGSASSGSDYTAASGTVTFLPGETSHTVGIAVSGDTLFEANETLAFNLSAPTNATLGGNGTGTITNDDTAPTLSIGNATVVEGDSGTTTLSYTVTLTGSTGLTTTVNYATANGTATAGSDYVATNGTLTFAPGEASKTINVTVNGDTTFEQNETVLVNLTAPTNATVATAQGVGTITNDDAAPPPANIWVNEIHYDNASVDVNEAIEIAGVAGTDLAGYTIVLYNGTNTPNAAPIYTPLVNLTGVIDNEGGSGYGALSFNVAGLQNGANDGFALVSPGGVVIQLLSYEGTFTAAVGTAAGGMTATDIGVSEDGSGAAGDSLQLTGNGAAGADFTWQSDSASSFGSLNVGQVIIPANATGQVSVSDASVVEGNSGTSNLVFTVHRAGGLGSAATVDYTINLDGTANAADLGAGAVLSGTVSFAVGAYTATVTIPIQGDTVGEGNETLSLVLSNPVGNIAITDGTAIGTIVNDDFVALTIAQIQGAGHTSAYVGQPVQTTGIVTATDTNGFWIQMAVGDGNSATSDAIFVFTSTTPTVVVGNGVTVGGTVQEFAGDAAGLTLTQITAPTVTVDSAVNALPAAILIGTGGILPPSQNLDDDHLTTFDPVHDGLDFWESLEGMRVTLDAPQAVSNTNSFGETDVVVSHGVGATGVNVRGGITISPNSDGTVDYNPEKIQIDNDSGVFAGFSPNYTIGDQLSSVTGIVNYSFDYYEVVVTAAVTITRDQTLTREMTTVQGNADYLTLATYNLENLDASDNKYTILASDMVYNLHAPDIIAVQEVQDADGAGSGTDLSGVSNAQGIIDAIFTISGKHYGYIEIAPTTTNTSGGEPGGNIRNGYFYNLDRVAYVANSAELINDPAYNGSRKPLVATWTFQGQNLTTIDVHSTSRGGSDPIQGNDQPADAAGDAQRTAQAAAVKAYVNAHLASDPNLNLAVLGDWNGFYFEQAQTQLTDPMQGGMLTNVNYLLTPEERYSYVFEGNSQQIDNILVSSHLLATVGGYDAVHLNSEFGGTRPTDHDPQVVAFHFANTTGGESFFGTDNDDTYMVDSLNDRVYENANGGNDTIVASLDYDLNTQPNVENLSFSGTGNFVGYGTSGNNVFHGNSGNNRFFGNGGTDTFYGGAGDDFFIVDSADDVVIELAGEGFDTIKSLVSYTLPEGSGVEALRLFSASNNDSATGNSSPNVLIGNAGANILDGGGGGDRLQGGMGNDTYIVRASNDRIIEIAGGGTNDTVKAAVSYALTDVVWVEQLTTIDDNATTAINLTGNAHTLILVGNEGANVLTGGSSSETLLGGGGADIFAFTGTVGHDIVFDFVSATDKLDLSAFFTSYAQVQAATHDVGGNAVIDLGGGNDVTLNGVTSAQLQSGDVIVGGGGGAAPAAIQSVSFASPYAVATVNPDTLGHGYFATHWGPDASPAMFDLL